MARTAVYQKSESNGTTTLTVTPAGAPKFGIGIGIGIGIGAALLGLMPGGPGMILITVAALLIWFSIADKHAREHRAVATLPRIHGLRHVVLACRRSPSRFNGGNSSGEITVSRRHRIATGAICLFSAFALPAQDTPLAPAPVMRVVDAYIQKLQVRSGSEEERVGIVAEHVKTGDLDGDGRDEIVVLYAAYYGNTFGWGQTVLTDRGKGYVVAAEAEVPLGQVASVEVKDGLIHVTSKLLGPNDPRCCPTEDHVFRLRWQDKALTEIDGESGAQDAPQSSVWEIRPLASGPPGVRVAGPGIIEYLTLLCTSTGPSIGFLFSKDGTASAYTAIFDLDNQRVQLPLTRADYGGGRIWTANLARSPLPRLLVGGGLELRVAINMQWQGEVPLHGAGDAAKTALSSCYRF